LTSIKLILTLL